MSLKHFDLVNTEGLKGLSYKGDFIAFADMTDQMAEQLEGKTHVLKRKTPSAIAKASAASEKQ